MVAVTRGHTVVRTPAPVARRVVWAGRRVALGHLHYLHIWWKFMKASMEASIDSMEASIDSMEAAIDSMEAFMEAVEASMEAWK